MSNPLRSSRFGSFVQVTLRHDLPADPPAAQIDDDMQEHRCPQRPGHPIDHAEQHCQRAGFRDPGHTLVEVPETEGESGEVGEQELPIDELLFGFGSWSLPEELVALEQGGTHAASTSDSDH